MSNPLQKLRVRLYTASQKEFDSSRLNAQRLGTLIRIVGVGWFGSKRKEMLFRAKD